MKEENIEESEGKRKIIIPGEVIVSGTDYLPGDGTRREGDEIVAGRFGLVDISGRLVKVIPLSGTYLPRAGNIVIGRVTDVSFNGWMMDIKSAYSAFLPLTECPRYIRGDLTEFQDIGDMICCKISNMRGKGVDLSIMGRGLGKLDKGMIVYVNSNKVPRIIGRDGSMVNLIKEKTGCDIVVGQNGIVWISGKTIEDELKAKQAILFIVEKSFVEGLTEKVKEYFESGK